MYLRQLLPVIRRMRCVRMSRVDANTEGPNIAGVSLALYLLVSILSMMAAYEVGKASDDVRNSVVVSHHTNYGAPNKPGDDKCDDPFVAPAFETIALHHTPNDHRVAHAASALPKIPRAFAARAPPASGSLSA